MILVTLGTQDKPFKRLIETVEKQVELGNIKDEVIVQSGCTKYKSDKMRVVNYIPMKDFSKLMKEADFLITHAGVASIIEGLKAGKKIIAVARKSEYGEHVNNHQEQILENFGEKGFIIPLYEMDKMNEALKKVKDFQVKEFKGNNEIFLNELQNEIVNLLN